MRALRIVLAVLGGFLVVAAATFKFYVADAAQKTPLTIDSTTHLTGSGQIIDLQHGGTKPIVVKAVSVNKADGALSDSTVVSWANTKCAVIDSPGTPDCLPPQNPQTVSWAQDYFATNRVDALAVDGSKYAPDETVQHQGLINKFPFHTQKQTYPYWDDTAGRAVDMAYSGTKTVDGTEVYVFSEHVTDAPIQVKAGIPGTYSMDRTVWVEPATGSIVNQVQHDVRKLDSGDTALDLNLAFTPDQVNASLGDAQKSATLLHALSGWAPLALLLVGLFALAMSLLMGLRTARRTGDHAAPAPSA